MRAREAVEAVEAVEAEVILVDSTGWIAGEDARRFKLFEHDGVRLVKADANWATAAECANFRGGMRVKLSRGG